MAELSLPDLPEMRVFLRGAGDRSFYFKQDGPARRHNLDQKDLFACFCPSIVTKDSARLCNELLGDSPFTAMCRNAFSDPRLTT